MDRPKAAECAEPGCRAFALKYEKFCYHHGTSYLAAHTRVTRSMHAQKTVRKMKAEAAK